MFSDDTVQELFMMASSENSAPQRFLILWKLRRHPQNTVSLSFFKWTPPKKYMLSSENVAMLFIFLEAVLSYISKTSRKLFDVHSGYSDCRTNLLLIYVDLLRKFGWHPYTIRWYFFLRPVIWLTEFRQKIISPGKRKSRMLHTKKGPREIYQIFLLVPCIHGKYWQIDVPYMVGFPTRSLWCNIFQAS